MSNWPWLIFVTVIGACVGSFLNVVIYRVPAGESLITPPSHCPKCGHGLAWFENVPILGWLMLRGRCWHCKAAISIQYPLVEAACAVLFGGLFVIYFWTNLRPGFSGPGLGATAPAFAVQSVMLAGLLAATVIDAKLYIIPISIPWTITLVALVVLPAAAGLGGLPSDLGATVWSEQIVPVMGWQGIGGAAGGVIGLGIAMALMRSGLLPRSFDEMEEQIDENLAPDAFLEHPHPRREVLKELAFVILPLAGIVVGVWMGGYAGGANHAHVAAGSLIGGAGYGGSIMTGGLGVPAGPAGGMWHGGAAVYWRVLAGVICGYLTGGGLIWGTRILGTLGFGREAMGLGDVHLLAAIGAVLGPVSAVYVFFIAPFLGLIAALCIAGISALLRGQVRVIPYGPYLAGAAVIMMVFHKPLLALFNI